MTRILAINASYRDDGITDQAVKFIQHTLQSLGAEVEIIYLRNTPIKFCLNCRECTQSSGVAPGKCVLDDDMKSLIEKIEAADAYILSSPTNFGTVTAVYKRFMERLVAYGYWPWGNEFPKFRKDKVRNKKAVLISSCAAPGLMGRLLYNTTKQLNMTARVIGANVVGCSFTGRISKTQETQLSNKTKKKLNRLAQKLV